MMKKTLVQILFGAVLLSCSIIFSGCAGHDEYPFSPASLEKRFGDSMEEVVNELDIDLEAVEVKDVSDNQVDILIQDADMAENQKAIGLTMSFYNETLVYLRYVSDDPGFIYDCAAELGNTYDEKYGEDLTDPTRSNSRTKAGRDDFVGGDAEFVGQWRADNEKISETVFDGEETKLLLRFDSIRQSDGEPGASLAISFVPMSEMW
ncbi:MAG TPA: hypothetical protein IAA60_07670 [Candidatus Ornithomonoglobus intestinigallinarum]|uniref:Lipoprotein n=1 Tax=Candidatus Ornithomonoglobus intestinigallinarum TaxID=2840894 RepID=A0A9D1H5T7_9FIRM|nr:hypothetical protein [Candidatus Ornithomonoglobus intestinigallinarum]